MDDVTPGKIPFNCALLARQKNVYASAVDNSMSEREECFMSISTNVVNSSLKCFVGTINAQITYDVDRHGL